jgi:hypothetical protein
MLNRLQRRKGLAAFALLAVVAEAAGRSVTARVDRALHVSPLAPKGADYYPFLLVAVKVVAALALAGLLARLVRAHATATAGNRVLAALDHRHVRRSPRLRPQLTLRAWAVAFAASSVVYLVQTDAEEIRSGDWHLFAPWLHTYALPVFAALSVLVALAWSLAGWVRDVEDYAVRILARVRSLLSKAFAADAKHALPADERGPRRRFGLSFESRPPPLAA